MRRPTKHRTKSGFYRNDAPTRISLVWPRWNRPAPVRGSFLSRFFRGLVDYFRGTAEAPTIPQIEPLFPWDADKYQTPLLPENQGIKKMHRRTQNR